MICFLILDNYHTLIKKSENAEFKTLSPIMKRVNENGLGLGCVMTRMKLDFERIAKYVKKINF